ncbi:MAG: hypothetical protein ACI8Z1_003875 [Candidatus Azotimanducaceae bacterium]|jgi:hypothetical protein
MQLLDALMISLWPGIAFAINALMIRHTTGISRALFVSIATMAFAQTAGFLIWPYSIEATFHFADLYLITGYWMFAIIVLFVNSLSEHPLKLLLLLLAPAVMTGLHLSGLSSNGYVIRDMSPMHLDGPMSPVVDSYLIFCLGAVVGLVIYNLKQNDEDMYLSKNLIFLVSLIPLIAIFSSVIIINLLEPRVSLRAVGPITMIWAALVFGYLSRNQVISLASGTIALNRFGLVPFVLEGNLLDNLDSLTEETEKQAILEALKLYDTKAAAAKALGISRAKLYRKLKLYGLSRNPQV